MATNYGAILGIKNKWAPILFAVLYFFLMLWYLVQAARRRQLVYAALAFFSACAFIPLKTSRPRLTDSFSSACYIVQSSSCDSK